MHWLVCLTLYREDVDLGAVGNEQLYDLAQTQCARHVEPETHDMGESWETNMEMCNNL